MVETDKRWVWHVVVKPLIAGLVMVAIYWLARSFPIPNESGPRNFVINAHGGDR
jgi:hypothetical protein